MFTGLVEDVGAVVRLDRRSDAAVLTIAPKVMPVGELELGESVAVNGCCLTVTAVRDKEFTVLAGAETLRRTTLGALRVQSVVNLERALRMGDRLGGHMVSGHVDGVGEVSARRDLGANLEIDIAAPAEILRYIIEKGSIAIDGISLTVNRLGSGTSSGARDARIFSIALIPHTVTATTLAAKHPGHKVNLEVDIVGKYVEKLVSGYRPGVTP